MKKNCWEFKKCGREPEGKNVNEFGVCPASINKKADGIHNGQNAGRCCWAVSGTLCEGEIQGTFARKLKKCTECDFFALVTREEKDILAGVEISKKIKENI